MPTDRNTYPIEIAGIYRQLPLFEVQPGLRIAVLNILAILWPIQACAIALEEMDGIDFDAVTAGAKSIQWRTRIG
jgi:adenine phosphoribosyltransferase